MAAINDAQRFLKTLSSKFPDNDPAKANNAVMIILILTNGVWRVVMNVERRKNDKHEWGFPGGNIDNSDVNAWEAAKRELFEETNHVFSMNHWKRNTEVKFTLTSSQGHKTRFYAGIYAPPNPYCMKGNPCNREVVFVEYPRVSEIMRAFEGNMRLKCGKFELPVRPCMWVLAAAFKK